MNKISNEAFDQAYKDRNIALNESRIDKDARNRAEMALSYREKMIDDLADTLSAYDGTADEFKNLWRRLGSAIKIQDWRLVKRIISDTSVTGVCPKCQINLYDGVPAKIAQPCSLLGGCPNIPAEESGYDKEQDEHIRYLIAEEPDCNRCVYSFKEKLAVE